MDQNVLFQSDCSIYKRTKSLKQMNEIAWFFACWEQFKEIKFWLITFGVRMVRYGCGQPGYKALKLNVSQEWIVKINWFFAWCYKFSKAERYFNDFLVGVAFKFLRP